MLKLIFGKLNEAKGILLLCTAILVIGLVAGYYGNEAIPYSDDFEWAREYELWSSRSVVAPMAVEDIADDGVHGYFPDIFSAKLDEDWAAYKVMGVAQYKGLLMIVVFVAEEEGENSHGRTYFYAYDNETSRWAYVGDVEQVY